MVIGGVQILISISSMTRLPELTATALLIIVKIIELSSVVLKVKPYSNHLFCDP
jgi:hypothetical protein